MFWNSTPNPPLTGAQKGIVVLVLMSVSYRLLDQSSMWRGITTAPVRLPFLPARACANVRVCAWRGLLRAAGQVKKGLAVSPESAATCGEREVRLN